MATIAGQKSKILRSLPVKDMEYPWRVQGAVWSANNWWVCNAQEGVAGSGGRETPHIGRFTADGKYLGRMTLLGAGHGSVFAMDGTSVIIGWDSAGGDRNVRIIPWTKGRKVKESEAPLLGTLTTGHYPLPLDGAYLTLARRDGTYMWFYLRLYAAPAVTTRTIRVPVYESPNNTRGPAMQGAFSFGKNVFVQWGWPEDRPQLLQQYQWGGPGSTINYTQPTATLDILKTGWQSGDTSTEPEGICAYNGRLVVGKQYNGHSKRAFRLSIFEGVKREAIEDPKPPPQPPWPPVVTPPKPPVNKCEPVLV